MRSITCPRCERTSYNLHDIRERYCGYCHEWIDGPVEEEVIEALTQLVGERGYLAR